MRRAASPYCFAYISTLRNTESRLIKDKGAHPYCIKMQLMKSRCAGWLQSCSDFEPYRARPACIPHDGICAGSLPSISHEKWLDSNNFGNEIRYAERSLLVTLRQSLGNFHCFLISKFNLKPISNSRWTPPPPFSGLIWVRGECALLLSFTRNSLRLPPPLGLIESGRVFMINTRAQ